MDVESQQQATQQGSGLSIGQTGTMMSFVVIVIGMIVSIVTYVYAPDYVTLDSWEKGCPSGEFEDSCKSNSAVLRVSCAMTILFAAQIVFSKLFTPFYDRFWVIKMFAFGALVVGLFFGNSSSFGLDGYAWFARISGFFFLILQQIILIDVAYSWNEKWLEYAGGPEGEKGKFWLIGIVVISLIMFAGSYAVIGIMFWQFGGCDDSITIISLTLVLSVIATVAQLFFSEQGSILTSSIMTSYATYVCYSAVTLNPNASCNLAIDTSYQTLSTVIGFVLLVISLLWTTYNTVTNFPTAYDENNNQTVGIGQVNVTTTADKPKTEGATSVPVPVPSSDNASSGAGGSGSNSGYDSAVLNSLFVQVSVVFLCVSGYYAMVLTNWATEQSGTSINNPRSGKAAMWIQAAGQWIAIVFFFWTLVAPKILTNREFN